MKPTQEQVKTYLKTKLGTNPGWASSALVKIYDFQTETEQQDEATEDHNGVGFTGADAEILTSFAKQYLKRGSLSPKQMDLLKKKMPKYWKQILGLSNVEIIYANMAKMINTN